MASLFSKIIAGDIPCYKIAENNQFFAFLDISPLAKGHTLVVPKTEVDYIFDIQDDMLANMMVFAKRIAVAIEKSVKCQRIGVAVIGLEVPHAHIHLVPISGMGDLNFSNPKLTLTDNEFKSIADTITSHL